MRTIAIVLFTIVALAPASAQTCIPAPSGLTAWWPGDGNYDDIAGGRNGTPNGVAFTPGVVDQAFSFNGASSVDVPDDPIWTLGLNDFSIDLWVKFNSLSGRDPFISHDEGPGQLNKWIFWFDTVGHDKLQGVPALRFAIIAPGRLSHDPVVAPWTPIVGQWYHVAVTRAGAQYSLYIDGILAATDTSTFEILDPNFVLQIGAAEHFNLNGAVDEVEIHSRALTAAEIAAIHAAGPAGKCKGVIPVTIDIKPSNDRNLILTNSRRPTPVAILSSATFSAPADVDTDTLTFGRTGSEQSFDSCQPGADVNGDGLLDLVCDFTTSQTGFQAGDTQGILKGATITGTPFTGSDSVRVLR